MLITAGTVVTGTRVLRPGWLLVAGATVTALGEGTPPPRPAGDGHTLTDLGAATVVPGFVDTHVHGGGGGSFPDASAEQTSLALDAHARHGTTTMMASLVSAGQDDLLAQIRVLADQVRAGLLCGIHLEGPWIAPSKKGAHDPTVLRAPDPAEVAEALDTAGGTVRMVTLAPELPGALDAVRQIVASGAVAAVGHTDATYDETRAAVAAGARVGTHLFNAMRPVHHREPGPVTALVEDPRVQVEMIGDGAHLHPAVYREVCALVGTDRVNLVTDAMAAAGMPDGAYRLGSLDVDVIDGTAHLAGTTTIAGSTATMDRLFRFAVANGPGTPGGDDGLLRAVRQTSVNPARTFGLPTVGLHEGGRADAVVLDTSLQVTSVLRGGVWVPGGSD